MGVGLFVSINQNRLAGHTILMVLHFLTLHVFFLGYVK